MIVQIPNRCICNTWRLFILQIYFDHHQFWKIQWKCIKIFDYQNQKKYGYKNNISVQNNSYMWKEITIGKDLLHAHDLKKEKTRNFNKLNKNIGTCTRYLTFQNKINLIIDTCSLKGIPRNNQLSLKKFLISLTEDQTYQFQILLHKGIIPLVSFENKICLTDVVHVSYNKKRSKMDNSCPYLKMLT